MPASTRVLRSLVEVRQWSCMLKDQLTGILPRSPGHCQDLQLVNVTLHITS